MKRIVRPRHEPGAPVSLDRERRIEMHSGDYVKILDEIPIDRLVRLIPALRLEPSDRVVDFASGTGVLAHLIAHRVASYEGVDFSADFVAFARARAAAAGLPNVAFHCRDIVEFCDDHEDEYDLVTSFDFSEHIDDPDFVRIFGGAHRILKPGGRLVLYTPNLDFFYERMKAVGLAKQFPQHIAVRNDAQHRVLLARCGFAPARIELEKPSHFNVFRHLHALRHVPVVGRWFEAKLFYRCIK